MTRIPAYLPAVIVAAALSVSLPAQADNHTVSQVKKTFAVPVLKAKIGDTVDFRNDDEFAHNVFSLSDAQSFDLGSYKKGEVRSVKLEKEGVIEVECAIHPEMKMKIEVKK